MKSLHKNNALTVGAVKTLKANTMNHKKILASSIIPYFWSRSKKARTTCQKLILKEEVN